MGQQKGNCRRPTAPKTYPTHGFLSTRSSAPFRPFPRPNADLRYRPIAFDNPIGNRIKECFNGNSKNDFFLKCGDDPWILKNTLKRRGT